MNEKVCGYRKDRIATYLREHTAALVSGDDTDIVGLDASDVALGLSLDRANVSRDLNALYRDGIAIKLLGKPTQYLHFHTVAERFSAHYIPNTIPIGQQLLDYIKNEPPPLKEAARFEQKATLVDSQYPSLWLASVQAESAINYPPHGLHTLLTGPNGSGKYLFARQMLAYGKAIGKLPIDAKLFSFDAHSSASSVQSLMIQLFGCTAGVIAPDAPSRKGLVERAEGCILLVTEVRSLPLPAQEKLIDLIMYGTFTRVGEAAVNRQCKLMLVATCGDPSPDFEQTPLLRYFPMHIALPPLSKRMVSERFLYLYQAFQAEAKMLDCEFHVSKDVFYHLLCTTCLGDFLDLRRNIKSICSMACREGLSDLRHHVFRVEYRHLPLSVLSSCATTPSSADFYAVLERYPQESIPIHASSSLPAIAPAEIKKPLRNSDISAEPSSILFVKNYLDEYLRSISEFEQLPPRENQLIAAHIVRNVCQDAVLGKLTEQDSLIQGLVSLLTETIHTDINYHLLQLSGETTLASNIPSELRLMAISLEHDICRILNQKRTNQRSSLIALYLYLIRDRLTSSHICMLILFHGRGVSRGIADYVNKLYHGSITPLDFDESSTSELLLAQIDAAVSTLPTDSQVLLFSDGLPFQTTHDYITQKYGLRAKGLCGVTFETLLQTVRNIIHFHYTLDMIDTRLLREPKSSASAEPTVSIVTQAMQSILSPSLSFIDVNKASPLMEASLTEINQRLNFSYSDNISIRYQFHCAHMIERLIRKEPLNYPHLKSFVNLHSREFRMIGEALQPIAQSYGIKIPTNEIAYLVEIFLSI